jgi:hypothetical protein
LWLFDEAQRRYLRAPKDLALDTRPAPETWEPYVALEFDANTGCFAVVLNETRTRTLRSHLHETGCSICTPATVSAA